ncbi:GATOR complex protein Iml1-like isoform X2 [Gigantopelta aegis]|uniref:GATOR complex protein Iml1-like isoform X2 n=1 Tax=Gigantopelta aegis TaxID=1735272 RepID=UPI001B88C7E9|nr:GATOR complex protein Iml1-like isoform X2 [Gigantopelta aegis]
MKTLKLCVHQKKFKDDDILINPKEFTSVGEGDVLEVYNPDNDYRRLLLQVQSLSEDFQQKDTVSIEQSIATAFHLRAYKDVCVNKIDSKSVALDLVELLYKEQYYSRSDMWRLRQNLVGTCVYLNKKVEFAEMRAQVNEMWSKGDRVTCGVIWDDTRVVFRSSTAVVQIFIQMSSEMWDFDINGDLYFEKAVNGFLTDLFAKWKEQNCCHDVTIVLFSRTFYDAKSLDEFPPHLRECLQTDHRGRIFEDFYRVVIQNERYDEWTNTLKLLRKYFNSYNERVVFYHRNEGHHMPRSWNSTAMQGNFLETLNMSLNLFENYYLDRNFDRTGKVSVVITPGPGVFEVKRELTNITKQRTIDCGVGSDLVCMGEQPLHAAPLFKFHSSKCASSIEVGDDYNIPHWMNHSYYASKNQIEMHNNSSFVPRIKPPPELLQRLAEKSNDPVKDTIPQTSYDSDDDKFPFVDYKEYDSQIFKLPSRNSTRVSFSQSSNLYSTHGVKRHPKTLAEARQQHRPRTRNLSDEFVSQTSEIVEEGTSKDMSWIKSNSSVLHVSSNGSLSQMTSNSCISQATGNSCISQATGNSCISPAVSIPSRSSSGDDISSSVGCYPIQEKTQPCGSVDSSEGEDYPFRRLVVGSAGSPIGHSRRSLLNYRPHRALINPFAPSRMRFKMTSNRRRWVHAFPTDPQGAAVQPHHVHIQSSSYHSDEEHDYGLQTLTPEVVQAAQLAVQARKRVSVSRQESQETETPDFAGQDSAIDIFSRSPTQNESRAMMNNMYQQLSSSSASSETVKPTLGSHSLGHSNHRGRRDRFWMWGTGEQEWSPDMTTGWDWRPLSQNETNNTGSQLIKTIISADMNSQNFCAGISVDWKSLTIPATLPITTDFFPDKRSLHYDYVVSDYSLLPDDNSDYGSKTSHTEDESFYRRKPPSTVQVFKELISQRLAQGFQMIKYSKNGSPGEAVHMGSSPQYTHTTGLMRSQPQTVQSEEYYLSIGRIFHKLTLTGAAITVTRYRPRHPQLELLHEYQYRFQAPDSYSYEVSFTKFRNQRLENYNWNYLDQYICTRGEGDYGLIDTLKYWRSRFFVLPCNNPATKKITDGSSRCDIYEEKSPSELNTMINGFVKMVEILNKLKRSQTRRSKVVPQPDSPASTNTDSSPGKPTEQESQKEKEDRLSMSSTSSKLIEALLDDKDGLFFLPKQTGLPQNCFISEEAVSWCQQFVHGVTTIDHAVTLMQRLMDDKLVYHSSGNDKHKFIYGFYIYCIPPSKGKPETLNLPYPNCHYNMLFQNEVMEVTCVPTSDADEEQTAEGSGKFFLPDTTQQESDSSHSANVTIEDWRVQTGMVKQGWGQQLATLLHKYVNVDVDAGKSKRPEWATARYHAYYSPACAFELQVQWMVTTGCLLGDLVYTWMRKAGSCGFHLLPVPVDPFALPNTENSDPLRGPIFVPLKISSLLDANNEIFCDCEKIQQERILQLQEAIIRRYGFMKTHIDLQKAGYKAESVKSDDLLNQYVHCTGGMFVLIPDSQLSSSVTSDRHYSPRFTKKSSSDLHKDYIARQQSNVEEAKSETGGIGFLWSWNFLLSKRWRSGNTGDEHFQDKMLADFRRFCSNEDGRLTEFWEEYQGKRL